MRANVFVRAFFAAMVNNLKLAFGVPLKPKYLWLEVTDKCNSKCCTCLIWRQVSSQNKKMDLADLSYILNQPLMKNIKYVLNSGGECTLENLEGYLSVEHNALPDATLQISSNALLPEKLRSAVIHAMNIGVRRLDVGLSIDGVGGEHDKIRGVAGNFELLEQSIKFVKDLQKVYPDRIFLSMGSTLTNLTAKNAQSLYAYSKQICVPFSWHWYNSSKFYSNSCLNNKVDKISEVVNDFGKNNMYWDAWRKTLVSGKIPRFRCTALNSFLVLKQNGDIVPCLSKWDTSIGNAKDVPLEILWKNASIQRAEVKGCVGCLNSWGYGWSIRTTFLPLLSYFLRRKFWGKKK